jgi:hypothetical protein
MRTTRSKRLIGTEMFRAERVPDSLKSPSMGGIGHQSSGAPYPAISSAPSPLDNPTGNQSLASFRNPPNPWKTVRDCQAKRCSSETASRPAAAAATRYATDLAPEEIVIQTTRQLMIIFQPDRQEGEPGGSIETALFLGVRDEPSLESTQLRWQVRLHGGDIVQLESGTTYLDSLGGALFLTTKEPQTETPPGETRGPIGWMKWMGEHGRRSFQIQLAISGVGFDRVCNLAEKGRYPDAILTFKDDGPIEHGLSPDGNKKIWKNVDSRVALIAEFTLRYDFSPFVHTDS